ncbi:MAG: hypothetical protein C0594_18045 [Marinilabiliales bacterium]|nr:MAG: hypothetical protein C0594_18045 [Marinilabiliales bacterium]
MRILPVIFFVIISLVLFSCTGNDKSKKPVKIIEEKDPIVKTIDQKDSLVIYKDDTVNDVVW